MANSRQGGLSKAKKNQADEFYTQYPDIQRLNRYIGDMLIYSTLMMSI